MRKASLLPPKCDIQRCSRSPRNSTEEGDRILIAQSEYEAKGIPGCFLETQDPRPMLRPIMLTQSLKCILRSGLPSFRINTRTDQPGQEVTASGSAMGCVPRIHRSVQASCYLRPPSLSLSLSLYIVTYICIYTCIRIST